MADRPQILRPRPLRAFNGAFAGPAADLPPPPPTPPSPSHHHSPPPPPPPQFYTTREASTSSLFTPILPISSTQDSSDVGQRTPEGSTTVNPANGAGSNDGGGSSTSSTAPSRSQSVLNLTSSALAGIFQPSFSLSSSPASPKYDSLAMRDSRLTTAATTTSSGARTQTLLYKNGESVDERINDEKKPRDFLGNNSASTITTGKRYNDDSAGKRSLESAKKKENEKSIRQLKVHHHMNLADMFRVLARLGLLFGLGIAYGLMVSRLHDDGRVAPVQVQGFDRSSSLYLCLWGCAGILLGTMMPWIDTLWSRGRLMKMHNRSSDNLWEKWYAVVRSVGAFVGVAFAIRKLPWQSTLQLSITLALANPALWYLLDRSSPGIFFSALISLIGTVTLLRLNPEMLRIVLSESSKERWITTTNPSYSASDIAEDHFQTQEHSKSDRDAGHPHHNASFLLYEQIGVVTWIASVLFCSCVCLGNIGRRLATES